MTNVLDLVRRMFDPFVERLGFDLFSLLTLGELLACALLVAVYEVMRQLDSMRFRNAMQVLSGALVPLLLLAVALVIYRFDRLA